MSLRDPFLASTWIWPTVTGRIARRVYAAIFLLLLFATASIRIYSYILTRRIQAVISGLSELQIDQTTEEELVRTVPHLALSQWGGQVKRTAETGGIDIGAVHVYYVTINNEASWMKFGRYITPLLSCCVKVGHTKDGYERGWIFALTELMGYRYVSFDATVTLLDGKVSSVSYGVADRLGFPRAVFQLVSVKSAHSFWSSHQSGFEVQSTDDESPQFRVNG